MTLGEGSAIGPYRLGPLLGRGGMAVVYEATHESIGRTVALKLISPDVTDTAFVERFRREGQMQAALDHPHVVPVYEAGTSEYGPYLAMRLVRGTTLASLIDEGTLTAARTLDLLEQVASALDAAHAAGLVHRDVKPRNVLVEDGDHAFLADFGLTRRGDVAAATATGHFMATIAYVAPEVVSGMPAGPEADRYALAAVLFECLTGTPVFPRPTQAAVLYAHTNEPPPRVSGRREGVPAALDEVLIAGLAKDPSLRPARATDLLARARTALSGIELGPPAPRVMSEDDDATTAGQVTQPVAPLPASAPNLKRVLAAAVLAGALLGAATVALLTSGGDPAPARVEERLPAAPAGTEPLGSALPAGGRTLDCRGNRVTPESPNCTIFQDRLADATLVFPRNGVIRRWSVRGATGELALAVLRRDEDTYFQIARSRNEFVEDSSLHVFPTDLTVKRGDRLGVVVFDGSGIGVRDVAGATTGRFRPILLGLDKRFRAGPAAELLVRADYLPGGRQRQPPRLEGAAAAAEPDGRVLVRRRFEPGAGGRDEARLVLVGGRGFLDYLRRGRRVLRMEIPGLLPPLDTHIAFQATPTEIYMVFSRLGSDRLVRHYLVFQGGRLRLLI